MLGSPAVARRTWSAKTHKLPTPKTSINCTFLKVAMFMLQIVEIGRMRTEMSRTRWGPDTCAYVGKGLKIDAIHFQEFWFRPDN